MRKDDLELNWLSKGKGYVKEVDRQAMYDVMDSIAKAFGHDNEISTVLCKVIPDADWIFIDKDLNETKDIPFINCKVNGEVKVIEIIRHHKIIWSILNGYTK